MDKIRELLTAYAKSNGYEIRADFRTKTRTYSRDGVIVTEDQILGTEAFAGFCDGYQHKPNKYKGPNRQAEDLLDVMQAFSSSLLNVPDELSEQIRSAMHDAGFPLDYDAQYKLDNACSK